MRYKTAERFGVKFDVGQIVITPAASSALAACSSPLEDLLARHRSGDWGDAPPQTRLVNERGLIEGFSVQSSYDLPSGLRVVLLTNCDRTLTTVHVESP